MRIYLATEIQPIQGGVLTNKKAKRRLISYYSIINNRLKQKQVIEYLTTGKVKK